MTRRPDRVHRRAVPGRHGRRPARCAAERRRPASSTCSPRATGAAHRRGGPDRGLGVRAGRRRRRDALVRGARASASRRRPVRCRSSRRWRCIDLMVGDSSVRPARTRATPRATPRPAVRSRRARSAPAPERRSASGAARTMPAPEASARRRCRRDDSWSARLIAVNAVGDIDVDGMASTVQPICHGPRRTAPFGNTTIGVIATNARARQVRVPARGPERPRRPGPVHRARSHAGSTATRSSPRPPALVDAPADHVRLLAAAAVERAVRSLA